MRHPHRQLSAFGPALVLATMTTEHRRAQWRRYSQSEKGQARRLAYYRNNRLRLNARKAAWDRANRANLKIAKILGVTLEQARRM